MGGRDILRGTGPVSSLANQNSQLFALGPTKLIGPSTIGARMEHEVVPLT